MRPANVPSFLEADSFEELVEGKLHADVEIAEFSVACGDLVEAHFVDDVLNFQGVLGEQGHAPFVFIEAG